MSFELSVQRQKSKYDEGKKDIAEVVEPSTEYLQFVELAREKNVSKHILNKIDTKAFLH